MMKKRTNNKTKTNIKAIVVLIIILLVVGRVGYYETHYYREGAVVGVQGIVVTVEDKCGYLWDFEGEGFNKEENVKMLMCTMGTDSNIYDDEVQDVKKLH